MTKRKGGISIIRIQGSNKTEIEEFSQGQIRVRRCKEAFYPRLYTRDAARVAATLAFVALVVGNTSSTIQRAGSLRGSSGSIDKE